MMIDYNYKYNYMILMLKDSEANSVQVNAFCAIDEFTTAYVHEFKILKC